MTINTFDSLKQYKTKCNKIHGTKAARQKQIITRCVVGVICTITLACCTCGFTYKHHTTANVRYTAGVASVME